MSIMFTLLCMAVFACGSVQWVQDRDWNFAAGLAALWTALCFFTALSVFQRMRSTAQGLGKALTVAHATAARDVPFRAPPVRGDLDILVDAVTPTKAGGESS